MPTTPQGVYYPSADDIFQPDTYLPQVAGSVTGVVVKAASATEAEALEAEIGPTSDRPLVVLRIDANQIWWSQGGGLVQFAPQPAVGFCQWGQAQAQTLTAAEAPLVGWVQRQQGGFMPADDNGDGSFEILAAGMHVIACDVQLKAVNAGDGMNYQANAQLRLTVNGEAVKWAFQSVASGGYQSLHAETRRVLAEGDVVAATVNVSAQVSQPVLTYGSAAAVQFEIAKTG